jgi:ABC-type antimicrobial peptide transport system permease subunit
MGHERLRTLQTIEEQLDDTLQRERLLAGTSASFGGVAAGVTLIGLYALLAHTVSRRTRDIGVRLAIGASRRHVIGSVLRQALGLTSVGLAIGIPVAIATGRLTASLLYGVRSGSPWVVGAVGVLFLLVATGAALVPARRAARVDPVVVLRTE